MPQPWVVLQRLNPPPGWKKLPACWPQALRPQIVGTTRLIILIPNYLIMNQSEECSGADQAPCSPLLTLPFKTFPWKPLRSSGLWPTSCPACSPCSALHGVPCNKHCFSSPQPTGSRLALQGTSRPTFGSIRKWTSCLVFNISLATLGASLVAQMVKDLPVMWETQVWSLGREDPLEKRKATHSSILAWRIPWTEEPGRVQSMGLQRAGHDWVTSTLTATLGRSPFPPQYPCW